MENRPALYKFGPYQLDPAKRLLLRDGVTLSIAPKTFDLLRLLVEGRGRVFTKKELMSALWSDSFVEEANLTFQISTLRKILGDSETDWIDTLPRYGYRFSSDVTEIGTAATTSSTDSPAAEESIPPHNGNGHRVEGSDADVLPSVLPFVHRSTGLAGWRSKPSYWVPAVLLALVTLIFAALYLRRTEPAERVVRFRIAPPDSVTMPDADPITISPDGERLAFIGVASDGGRQLWVRAMSSLAAEPLPGTDRVESAFWSPDGRMLAFFAAGKLKKLDLKSGGVAQVICNTPVGPEIGRAFGTWNSSGVILFATTERPEIYRVSADGGEPKPITSLDSAKGETRHSAPQFLPDGNHFIYFVQSSQIEKTGTYVASLSGDAGKLLLNSPTSAVYARSAGGADYLLFTEGTGLLAQSFRLSSLKLIGNAFPVAQRILVASSGIPLGGTSAAISASTNGVLAFRARGETGSTELVWLDRAGRRLGRVGDPGDYSNPAISPDEKKLAIARVDAQGRGRDLWLVDLVNSAFSRFTFDPADETGPLWSPDGSRIAYDVVHNGVVDVYQKQIAGSSDPQVLVHSNENTLVQGWTPDGHYVLVRTAGNVWAVPSDGKGKRLGPFAMETPTISPNGRWVAYASTQSGRSEVSVQGFPALEGKWQVSSTGGAEPLWSRDGKELYFLSGSKLVALPVRTDAKVFESGPAKPLFEVALNSTARRTVYQVASQGQRFLFNLPLESSSPITVTINWVP